MTAPPLVLHSTLSVSDDDGFPFLTLPMRVDSGPANVHGRSARVQVSLALAREIVAHLSNTRSSDRCDYGAPSAARCVLPADHAGDHVPDAVPFPAIGPRP